MTNIVLTALLFVYLALILVWEILRSVQARRNDRRRDCMLQTLQNDIHALCTGAAAIGNHLGSIEQRIKRLNERQDQLDLRDPIAQSYGHAIRLVQRGAGIQDLIDNCGLPVGEAELLLRLHRSAERH